ncbi:caspase family protein [Paracoccus indicus]|uniref:caspase family protein n=1 Tax=Paracoccus indicus TaxID=2079229 RepID=UPI000D3C4E16|nr:caspase family protein [Paracoccus indicus]
MSAIGPIFRNQPEITAFFARAAPFVDAESLQVQVDVGPALTRVGDFAQLSENAGELNAIFEVISEVERQGFDDGMDLPHLVIFPSGWAAMLRHPDCGAQDGQAMVRVLICPCDPKDADAVRGTLVQLLAGLQDSTGRSRTTPPLIARQKMDWPAELEPVFDRDSVEAAFRQLMADDSRHDERRIRSEVIDDHLRWLAANRPVAAPLRREVTPAPVASSRGGTVDLKHHVVNMRFGALSRDGAFQTDASDVAAIADRARDWIDQGSGRRLVIYAHGGLVSEGLALDYARSTAAWWLENDVYPVFCIWESDALSVIWQMIAQQFGRRATRGFDLGGIRDAAIEGLVQIFGRGIWATMKNSARQCSAPGDQHGLTLLARELGRVFGPDAPIDLVGHSAGSIVLLHLLPVLRQAGCPAQSLQTLAPAATTALYRSGLAAGGATLRHRIYTMTDTAERDDTVIGIYGKSLLYLVAFGFETSRPTPIAGLQRDLLDDTALVAGLADWANGVTREALVFSPSPQGTPRRLRSDATSHGGFDNDPATMWSVMRFIRGPGHDARITPFPENARSARGGDEMMPRLPDDLRLYLEMTDQPAPAATPEVRSDNPPAMARQPARIALTIGIDHYAGAAKLNGCARDSDSWRDLLEQRGYHVTQITAPEQTHRDALVAHLRDFVARGRAGDSLIWHYSGHGMEVMPEFGTDDDDGDMARDQAIVASNNSPGLETQLDHALIDDQIHTLLQALDPAAQMHVFLDSCHSGSATRLAMSGRPRSLGTLRKANYVPHGRTLTLRPTGMRGTGYEGSNHVLYSASSAIQTAQENGSPVMGVFSRAVRDMLAANPGAMTNTQFRARINALTAGNNQTPGVYCDPARMDQAFPLV